MAQLTLGRVTMMPKGNYSSNTKYNQLDIVSYNNATYMCTQKDTLGIAPTQTSNWMFLVSGSEGGGEGSDGFSPIANVNKVGNTATITITDKLGTTSANITDGSKGDKGDTGAKGDIGETGRSAYEQAVDGGYTSTESQFNNNLAVIDETTSNSHTHSNKTVLDNTTASYLTAEKTKLSGIATGATANTVTNNLTSSSTTNALSANQGRLLNINKLNLSGGILTGSVVAKTGDDYAVNQIRNIRFKTSDFTTSELGLGEIGFVYEA